MATNIRLLLDMVATEALEGGSGYSGIRDEAVIDTEGIGDESVEHKHSLITNSDISLKLYDIGLIRDPETGKVYWGK